MNPSSIDPVIHELDGFLGLELIEIESGIREITQVSFTKYKFKKDMTDLTISLSSRDNFKSRGFGGMLIRGRYQYIDFEDYLKFTRSPDLFLFKEFERIENEEEMLNNILRLFKKHLEGDLRKVIDGDGWIEVPFDRD